MTVSRRHFLCLASAAITLSNGRGFAQAQGYPTRPVRLIVGYPPGSTADILARLVSQSLTERLGQPIVIENRPGAASTIATEAVVRAAPDGHTLLFITSPNLLHDYLYKNLSFNFMRDIAPVAGIGHGPFVMLVNPSVPVHTVAEFIAYAKANPGRLNMASGGNATTTHVAGELFKMMAGVDMLHVPYRGEPPALTDLIAGQVQMMFVNVPPVIPYLRAGRLRALAVTSASRFEMLPGATFDPALARDRLTDRLAAAGFQESPAVEFEVVPRLEADPATGKFRRMRQSDPPVAAGGRAAA